MRLKLGRAGVVVVAVVTVLAGGLAARAADDKKVDDDKKADAKVQAELKKMEGEWTGTTPNGDEVVYVFKGDRLTAKGANGEIEIRIKLDPSARPNKAMDGTHAGDEGTIPAIYKFDGNDKLVICYRTGEGAKRPREFEDDGDRQRVVRLTRRAAKADAGGSGGDSKKQNEKQ